MRPGGTYYFHVWAEDLPRVMKRGRLQHAKVLNLYIQSLQEMRTFDESPEAARVIIQQLTSLFAYGLNQEAMKCGGHVGRADPPTCPRRGQWNGRHAGVRSAMK